MGSLLNQTMIIGSAAWNTYVYPCAMEEGKGVPDWNERLCEFPGFTAEILYMAARVAKIKYKIISLAKETELSQWGKLNRSSKDWDGMLGMVQDGTIDVINAGYFATYERFEYFDFAFPLVHSKTKPGFILAHGASGMPLTGSGILYRMFQPYVWFSFILLALLGMLVLMISRATVDRYRKPMQQNRSAIKEACTAIYDVAFTFVDQHFGRHSEHSQTSCLAVISIGFLTMFFHSMYNGYLVTLMLRAKSPVPFRSTSELADLVAQGKYTIITFSTGDYYMSMIERGDLPPFKKMQLALKKNPYILETNYTKMLDRIQADTTLVHPGRSGLSMVPSIVGRCNLMFQEDVDVDAGTNIALMFKKGSKFGAIIGSTLAGMLPS